MNIETNPLDLAFPAEGHPGLTKREYFAAAALASFDEDRLGQDEIAKTAVSIADALIVELNKID